MTDDNSIEFILRKDATRASRRPLRTIKLDGAGTLSTRDSEGLTLWEINIRQYPIRRGERENEFIVSLPDRDESYFTNNEEELEQWITAMEKATNMNVLDVYDLGEMLGEGAFAQVFLGVRKFDKHEVAVKVIEKDEDEIEFIIAECNIMKSISHPNVVRTFDIFDSKNRLYLVMEFMPGGELFDMIAESGHLTEHHTAQIMKQICAALDYIHQFGYIHRDIKPENVLCVNKEFPLDVKISDFGLAAPTEEGVITEKGLIGTPGYVAPEMILKKPYGPAVDMWSVGVLLYIMLSGKMPFYGRDDIQCLNRIAKGEYSMEGKEWAKISAEAKSLVKALLQLEPSKRLTARTVMYHPWMETASDVVIGNDLSGIHSARRKFKRAVNIAIMLNRLKVKEEALAGTGAKP